MSAAAPRGGTADGVRGEDSSPRTTTALRCLFAYRLVSRAYFHLPVLFVFIYLDDHGTAVAETLLALYGFTVMVSGALSTVSVPSTKVMA